MVVRIVGSVFLVVAAGLCYATAPRASDRIAEEANSAAIAPSEVITAAAVEAEKQADQAPVNWWTDYGEALAAAVQREKMLFVFFASEGDHVARHFEAHVLSQPEVRRRLEDYVYARLPLDTTILVGGEEIELLDHAAFDRLGGSQGIAIIDYANPPAPHYGWVVTAVAFRPNRCLSAEQMEVILDLPPGRPADRNAAYATRIDERRGATARSEEARRPARSPAPPRHAADGLYWFDDYADALAAAENQQRMLLIHFREPSPRGEARRFENEVLAAPAVVNRLRDYVLLRLPLDAEARVNGSEVTLLRTEPFREMLGRPGVAVIDYEHTDSDHYGHVVSTFPITGQITYNVERMQAILDLPPGTLTQRTLIWAVRVHPERPSSTNGNLHDGLREEAASHSRHQARILRQGHHNWNTRFHRINRLLPGGLAASEVCAESWPGQNLVEAALDAVRSWRQSSGHWSAVRGRHRYYAYDMKRGANGIWYATGIFARQ